VLQKFQIKYGIEWFEERTAFSSGTSSDSKWILNEKIREDLGFQFD
jgi:hypothetical protein